MILTTLQREWDDVLAPLPSPWPGLPGTLADVHEQIRSQPDRTLLALLMALAGGDQLAGRVVVASLLPKLRLLAAEGLDAGVLVSHLWLVAAGYPCEQRPSRVAANLLLDARKRTLAERARDVRLDAVPEPTAPAAEPGADEVLAAAQRLCLLTPGTRSLLEGVYADGLPRHEVARRHGVTEPALRQRCSKAVRRMSGHRLALVA